VFRIPQVVHAEYRQIRHKVHSELSVLLSIVGLRLVS
jgi:hypothetical protein